MYILASRGLVSATTHFYTHYDWSQLKRELTKPQPGKLESRINADQWDLHEAWAFLQEGYIIVDGTSMWQLFNAYEQNESMEEFELFKTNKMMFLPERDKVLPIFEAFHFDHELGGDIPETEGHLYSETCDCEGCNH